MSWHCRLAAIGQNRPKANGKPRATASPPARSNDMDDEIPF
jgi:hypothetical protein